MEAERQGLRDDEPATDREEHAHPHVRARRGEGTATCVRGDGVRSAGGRATRPAALALAADSNPQQRQQQPAASPAIEPASAPPGTSLQLLELPRTPSGRRRKGGVAVVAPASHGNEYATEHEDATTFVSSPVARARPEHTTSDDHRESLRERERSPPAASHGQWLGAVTPGRVLSRRHNKQGGGFNIDFQGFERLHGRSPPPPPSFPACLLKLARA